MRRSRRFRTAVLALVALACVLPIDLAVPSARAAIGCTATGADIVADGVEFTQSVQDGLGGLPMLAGKRTYARLYSHVSAGTCISDATLTVRNGSRTAVLEPLEADGVDSVGPDRVDRDKRDDAAFGFLFELPTFATSGQTSVLAEVNPNGTIPESNRANNVLFGGATAPITFQTVPRMSISFDRVSYSVGGTTINTPLDHVAQMARWIQRAYPTSGVDWRARNVNVGARTVNANGEFSDLTCDDLNFRRLVNDVGLFNFSELFGLQGSNRRLYSMIHDGDGAGGFMRGCALLDEPPFGPIASGPTGSPDGTFAPWDTDGIYGDWYGAHEIGHTLDRRHVRCPSDIGGPGDWPYPNGLISPQGSNNDAAVGFDVETRETYPHDVAHDIMTYCEEQWVSDVSYKLFGDHIVRGGPTGDEPSFEGGDDICVAGTLGVGKASPEQTRLLPTFGGNASAAKALRKGKKKKGKFAIELRDAAGELLRRERFKPLRSRPGAPLSGPAKAKRSLLVLRCLEFDPRVSEVVVVGPGRKPLGTIEAGTSAPAVEVLPPGQTAPTASPIPTAPPTPTASPTPTPTPVILFSNATRDLEAPSDTLRLAWRSSDPDGDALSNLVQTSTDGGKTWRTVAAPTSATTIDIPRENLTAGQNVFRVLSTDGVHVSSDVLDNPVIVGTTGPLLEIRSPSVSERVRTRQTISLEAFAYDLDTGSLDGNAVRWSSDKDGDLGIGDQITVTGLSPGGHSITVTATGPGGTTSRVVPIVVL